MKFPLIVKSYKNFVRLYILFLLKEVPYYCIVETIKINQKSGVVIFPLGNEEFRLGENFFLKKNFLFIGSFSLYNFIKTISCLRDVIFYKIQVGGGIQISSYNFFFYSYFIKNSYKKVVFLLSLYCQLLKILLLFKKQLLIIFKNDNFNTVS